MRNNHWRKTIKRYSHLSPSIFLSQTVIVGNPHTHNAIFIYLLTLFQFIYKLQTEAYHEKFQMNHTRYTELPDMTHRN